LPLIGFLLITLSVTLSTVLKTFQIALRRLLGDCVVVPRKAKPPKKILSKVEFLALKSLRDNPDIVILRADKGGVVVILDKSDYVHKMVDHLFSSGSYIRLKKNPIMSISKEVASANKVDMSLNPLSLKLIERNPLTPKIYGLPKVHKSGPPLRPIVNTIGEPTYLLAKFLSQKLKPLVGRIDSFVKDSASFVQEWRDVILEPGDLLVSFDVVCLFTKIPIQEAIDIINRISDKDTTKSIGLCLTSTFFSFQGKFYEQTCGVAMGSPLSPIVANLFIENFKTKALATAQFRPQKWKRFDDDTCVIWSHGREKLDMFLNHLNSQSNSIKFTMEVEENGCLPFLDILLSRREDGSICHQVFRKKTHVEQFLHASSHHFPTQKFGVLSTLATHALRISDDSHLQQ